MEHFLGGGGGGGVQILLNGTLKFCLLHFNKIFAAYKYAKEWQVKQIVFILNSPKYSYENERFIK